MGLGEALRENAELPRCLVQRVYSYGTGGPPGVEIRAVLDYFNEEFATQGYRFRELLRMVALSKAFSRVQEDPSENVDSDYQGENQIASAQPTGEMR
ncbi:hypothetical protein NOR53_734 [gamma proteobacterium NOR5-3]|nr:hypothetical protein NOR53_734 [gamma proteobacterium NOR5-3]